MFCCGGDDDDDDDDDGGGENKVCEQVAFLFVKT
jgi:hypothetical protein